MRAAGGLVTAIVRAGMAVLMLCAALALGALSGCGSSDTVVARVGHLDVTDSMLAHWVSVFELTDGGDAQKESRLRQEVLELLIAVRWADQQAAQGGIDVPAEQASHQLAALGRDEYQGIVDEPFPGASRFDSVLTNPRIAHTDRLWLMAAGLTAGDLARQQLQRAESEISSVQIGRYYEQHLRSFVLPESRDLYILQTFDYAVALKARREIESGESFQRVARRITTYERAPDGVRFGFTRADGVRRFDAVAFAAKPHVLIGPFRLNYEIYDFEVRKIHPSVLQPLTQVAPAIRRALASKRATSTLRVRYEQRWSAMTSCQPGYVVPGCSQYRGTTTGQETPSSITRL
jgi:hypothetical protein